MAIRERAQQILRLPNKEAKKEGMKLIANALLNNEGTLEEIQEVFGKNYYRYLVADLKKQFNTL